MSAPGVLISDKGNVQQSKAKFIGGYGPKLHYWQNCTSIMRVSRHAQALKCKKAYHAASMSRVPTSCIRICSVLTLYCSSRMHPGRVRTYFKFTIFAIIPCQKEKEKRTELSNDEERNELHAQIKTLEN